MKKKRIEIRVSDYEHNMIISRANETGVSVSDYLRQVGTGGKAVSASAIQSLTYECRAIGNNINQLSKKANIEGMDTSLYDESLSEIKTFISFLNRVRGGK